MLLSLNLWSLKCPHWHQKYLIYYLWLDTAEGNWGNPNQRDAATQVQSVRFSLRAFLVALVFFFFGLNKKNKKNLAATLGDLHLHWCTYIDRERVLKAKRWEIRKKVKEETSTELLINQGVDVRFQNMWWVEYQRVKE